jgi:hypothetical protein
MRRVLVIVLALAGCAADTDTTGPDLAARSDLATCTRTIPSLTSPTTCGAMTCAPGFLCLAHQPGAGIPPDFAVPVDGGTEDGGPPSNDPYQRSCLALPPECLRCGGCGEFPGSGGHYFGCAASICDKYETGCRLEGATLTCIGL